MEGLILGDKLWEQVHVSFLKCFNPDVLFPEKLRIVLAFFDIFDVAFNVLEESTIIDWRSMDLDQLYTYLLEFETKITPGKSINRAYRFRTVLFHGQFIHALLSQLAMQRSRGEPFTMESKPSLTRVVGLLGLGTQEDFNRLIPGTANNVLDMMIKVRAMLNKALLDGPLSNFCILGRASSDIMASDVSDLMSDVAKKAWKTLQRMVDTQATPFANSSKDAWSRFDQLCILVRDPGGNSQTVERLQPILDIIEQVERVRPPVDERAEGTGNVVNQTRPGGPPLPGSSLQVGASHIERGPEATFSSPFPGTIPLVEMPQSLPSSRTSPVW